MEQPITSELNQPTPTTPPATKPSSLLQSRWFKRVRDVGFRIFKHGRVILLVAAILTAAVSYALTRDVWQAGAAVLTALGIGVAILYSGTWLGFGAMYLFMYRFAVIFSPDKRGPRLQLRRNLAPILLRVMLGVLVIIAFGWIVALGYYVAALIVDAVLARRKKAQQAAMKAQESSKEASQPPL